MPNPEQFHELVTNDIANPYPVYQRFREAGGGLHRIERPGSGREPEWVVLRYDDASTVLSSRGFGRRAAAAGVGTGSIIPRDFAALSALVDNWLVFMDPPRHTKVRAVAADCVAARLRLGMPARIIEIVEQIAAGLTHQPRIELVDDFAAAVPMAVILEVLGVPAQDRARLRGLVAALQEGSSFRPGPREQRLATAEGAARTLTDYFQDTLAQRRRVPRDDVMSALVAADWEDGVVSDDLLVGTCVHLLASGHEATTNALAKAALLLLRHQDVLNRLCAGPDLVPAAVDELIRFDSPAQMVTRWAYQDDRLGDVTIRRGEKVTVVLGSANRDPARFSDPDQIRLDRDVRAHCGFGFGAHYCLGSTLGRMEVQAGVAALLKLLPDLRLASETVPYRPDLVFHGPQRLPLIRLRS